MAIVELLHVVRLLMHLKIAECEYLRKIAILSEIFISHFYYCGVILSENQFI